MLGGFNLAGTLGRFWDIGEHKRRHFDVQAAMLGLLWIFGGFGDPIFRVFGYLGQQNVYFVMLVSRFIFLMVFGSES